MRAVYEPILAPPVWVSENSDGTLAWPVDLSGQRVWFRIESLADLPQAWSPPRRRIA